MGQFKGASVSGTGPNLISAYSIKMTNILDQSRPSKWDLEGFYPVALVSEFGL